MPPRAGRAGVHDLAAVTRIGTGIAGAAVCLAGGSIGGRSLSGALLLAMLSVTLLITFAQVVNDIVDVDLDRGTKPHRPLVTGPLTVRGALAIALLALGGAVAAAVPLGRMLLGAVSAIAALSLAYSLRLKDTVLAGNVVVALLASTPVTIGAAATGRVGPSAIVAQVSVFLFMLGFEVIKTGCDVDGDGRAGLRTIATVHGVMPTASVAAAAVVGFFIAALALTAYAAVPIAYLAIIATTAVVPAVIALLRLLPASTPAQLRRAFVPMRWAWFGGVASLMLV